MWDAMRIRTVYVRESCQSLGGHILIRIADLSFLRRHFDTHWRQLPTTAPGVSIREIENPTFGDDICATPSVRPSAYDNSDSGHAVYQPRHYTFLAMSGV